MISTDERLSPLVSLLVKQWFNISHHIIWVNAMGEELDDLTLAIQQILGKIPFDLVVGRLFLQVLVDCRGVITLNIDFAHERETDLVVLGDPVLNL